LIPQKDYYSISLAFAIFLCMVLVFYKKSKPVLPCIVSVALTVFGVLTYSKMFLLAFVLLAFTFVFIWGMKSPKRTVATLLFLVLAGIISYRFLISVGYIDEMAERLFSGDISTGRFDIWQSYIGYFNDSPFTFLKGDGLGAPYSMTKS